jgi:hypothetical protein
LSSAAEVLSAATLTQFSAARPFRRRHAATIADTKKDLPGFSTIQREQKS